MRSFIQYYHLEIVSQMSQFTTASHIGGLNPEELLRLLDFIDVRPPTPSVVSIMRHTHPRCD